MFPRHIPLDSGREPLPTREPNQFAELSEVSPISDHAMPTIFCQTESVLLRLRVIECGIRIRLNGQNLGYLEAVINFSALFSMVCRFTLPS